MTSTRPIKINFKTQTQRFSKIEDSTMTVKEALQKHGIDYTTSAIYVDGTVQRNLDVTFDDLGIRDEVTIAPCTKVDNA